MDLQEAKRLFFACDGSSFHMTRECVLERYQEAEVPPELEAAWREELTRERLRLLHEKANFRAVCFLVHYGVPGHLAEVLQADPKGDQWEKCAFLECLLEYACKEEAGANLSLVSQAARKAIVEAERLLRRAKTKKYIDRIQKILDDARRLLDKTEAG